MKARYEMLIFPDSHYGRGARRWVFSRWRWQVTVWFLWQFIRMEVRELRVIDHKTGEHLVV